MEDKEIVDLYWQRDERAITATSEKYGRYCGVIANNILHDALDAEECVNDAYIGAWNSMPENRPEKLRHYLGRMTRWIALNRLDEKQTQKRGGGVRAGISLEELGECLSPETSMEEYLERKELCGAINRFLSRLRPAERQVFLSRYWFMAPVSEIAGKFGFTQSKVKSMLMRTRKKLQKFLEEEGLC